MEKNFKKIGLAVIIMAVVLALPLSAEEKSPAVSYLDLISSKYDQISKDMWEYIKTAAHTKSAFRVESKRKALIRSVEKTTAEVKVMKGFNNDTSLKDAVLKYLTALHAVLTEDYAKLVNMEEIAEQSYDDMEAYMLAKKEAGDKMDQISNKLDAQVKEFAKNNNIKLLENTDQLYKNLKIAGQVMDYYSIIYLVFFKSYKQENALVGLLDKNDINQIEQNRGALLNFAGDGLKKVGSMKGYDKDASLRDVCEKVLKFYKDEASEKCSLITDYLMKLEIFNKIKKSFNAKKKSDITQDDVDKYNQKVNELNAAGELYKKSIDEMNSGRKTIIDEWNKTASDFLDTHVPR